MKIHIVGLGAGDLDQLSLGAYRTLTTIRPCFLRTKEHPIVSQLGDELTYESFDDLYEASTEFQDVYTQIVEKLISYKETYEEILYAVPGHPLVAELTVQLLIEKEKQGEISLQIHSGGSFLDEMFRTLRIDPIEGFIMHDATAIKPAEINVRMHQIFCQTYDRFVAGNLKLALMQYLPDDYEVFYVSGAGTSNEKILTVPLYELDHSIEIDNLASLYVPPVTDREDNLSSFQELVGTIAALREPGGCPWDQAQTHQSLRKYLLEESYEVIEAIQREDSFDLEEELGDVLLQVLLHSKIAEENEEFSIYDVIRTLHEKMIRRHPHVFSTGSATTVEEVRETWESLKQQEKETKSSLLDGVNEALPQLEQSIEIQKKAGKVGFDWEDVIPMWNKVQEEIREFQEVAQLKDVNEMESEFGDILFAIGNIARFYGISPEIATQRTNNKFRSRFMKIEQKVIASGKPFEAHTLVELDRFWEEAKREE